MKKLLFMAFTLLTLIIMGGCTNSKKGDLLAGNEYVLVQDGKDTNITLSFADLNSENKNRFNGNASINNYFGNYKIDGNKLIFGDNVGTTMMAGPKELMNAEKEYLDQLKNTITFTVDGDTLTINLSNGGKLVYKLKK